MKRRFCPDCDGVTPQHVGKYDPDDPDSMLIWICNICGESVDIYNGEDDGSGKQDPG